jgi:hypothetical protein
LATPTCCITQLAVSCAGDVCIHTAFVVCATSVERRVVAAGG